MLDRIHSQRNSRDCRAIRNPSSNGLHQTRDERPVDGSLRFFVETTFPAPYRVEVFEKLRSHFSVFVAYEGAKDSAHDRNADWYVTHLGPDSVIVRSRETRKRYSKAKRDLSAYDAVLVYEYSTLMAMRLMLQCLSQGVPYLINADGGFVSGMTPKTLVKRFFVSRAHACLAGSDSAEQYFRAYGARPANIFRHNFSNLSTVDILKRIPSAHEKAAIRRGLGLPVEARIVLGVGQFIPRKGFDVLLEAWRQLDTDATLIIMGGGPEEPHYRRTIDENKMPNVVIKGFGDKRSVFDHYLASDCFVLPSREDVWGLVVNEAMACGLPVITTNRCVAGVELIEQGVNGILVDPDDPVALSRAIDEVLKNGELRSAMANANIAKIASHTTEALVQSHADTLALLFARRA